MPVRSRAKLLATLAALIALGVAGSGCQSCGPGRLYCCKESPGCGFTETKWSCGDCSSCVASGTPVARLLTPRCTGQAVSRPLFNLSRNVCNTSEPQLASTDPSAVCTAPACTMLRPVPIERPTHDLASDSSGLQRVSVQGFNTQQGTINTAGSVETAGGFIQPTNSGPEVRLTPMPLVLNDADKQPVIPDLEGKKDLDKAKSKSRLLPKPREETDKGATKDKAGEKNNNYPVLPTPVVTNPPVAPREFEKRALSMYIIEPPDVLQVELAPSADDPAQPITGPHLVKPDGHIGLGSLGQVFVAGLTLDQAKLAIAERIREQRQPNANLKDIWQALKVEVLAFNSKFYYVIADGGGYGETVVRLPCTGNETVLDAIAQIQGLPVVASKKQIWVARATPHDHAHPQILPVDWCSITQRGSSATNYQIYPGDRIYVNSDPLIRTDSFLAKAISPIERLLGVTLLSSVTVNSIKQASGSPRDQRNQR
jgi:protein involved in polysaccharide export with SLBB domain